MPPKRGDLLPTLHGMPEHERAPYGPTRPGERRIVKPCPTCGGKAYVVVMVASGHDAPGNGDGGDGHEKGGDNAPPAEREAE